MPSADHGQLRDWSHTLTRGLDPSLTAEEDDAATAAGQAMFDYVGQVVADKRKDPGDDILTALIQAEEAGDRLDHRRDPGPGDAALHRRARDDGEPDRQRADPPLPLPRADGPPPGRSRPRRQRRRGDAPLRRPGPVHPAGQPGTVRGRRRHHPGGQPADPGARLGQPRSRASGGRPPTSSTSPGPAPTSTSPSAEAPTSASAMPWPGWRPRPPCPSCSDASPAWNPPRPSRPGCTASPCAASKPSRSCFADSSHHHGGG